MPSSILGCLLRARLVMIEGRLGIEEAWESAVSWPREHKTSRKSRRRWARDGVGESPRPAWEGMVEID